MAHIKSILPQRGGVAPIDNNTTFLAHYDEHANDYIKGIRPIGSTKAISMNGTTSYISTNDIPVHSISMWVCFNSIQGKTNPTLYNQNAQNGASGYSWVYTSGASTTINWQYTDGAGTKNLYWANIVEFGKWMHLTFVYDDLRKNITLYKNGKLISTQSCPNAKLPAGTLHLGTYQANISSYPFAGEMCEVKVWGRPLTETEVMDTYTNVSNVNDSLYAYWKLNEGSGSIAYNYATSGSDAIITNGIWAKGPAEYSLVEDNYLRSSGKGVLLEEGTVNLANEARLSGIFGDVVFTYVGIESGYKKYSIGGTWSSGSYPYSFSLEGIDFIGGKSYSVSCSLYTNVPNKFAEPFGTIHMVNDANITGEQRAVNKGNYNAKEDFIYSTTQKQPCYIGSRPKANGTVFDPKTDFVYIKDFQIEQKPYATSFTSTSRNRSFLRYPKEIVNPDSFTFSCWVKLNVLPSIAGAVPNGCIPIFEIARAIEPTNRLLFGWFPNNELTVWKSTTVFAENGGIYTGRFLTAEDVGAWHMYAVTYDGQTYKAYVDGELIASSTMPKATLEASATLCIGGYTHGTLNGIVDEVRVDKIARTKAEITSWYYNGRNGV